MHDKLEALRRADSTRTKLTQEFYFSSDVCSKTNIDLFDYANFPKRIISCGGSCGDDVRRIFLSKLNHGFGISYKDEDSENNICVEY